MPDKYAKITKKTAFVVAVAMSLFQLYTGLCRDAGRLSSEEHPSDVCDGTCVSSHAVR